MADSGRGPKDSWGSYLMGACHDGLGPGLGQLYEAWREDTGAPVLLVRPGTDVDWQPEGPLQVHLRFHPSGSTVSVETEAPTPPELSDVANLLVLTTAAITRVENRPQVRAHVASRPRTDLPTLPLPSPQTSRFGRGWVLAGFAGLAVGAGVWLCSEREPVNERRLASLLSSPTPGSMTLSGPTLPGEGVIAYPMPDKPFPNQAAVPCYPQLDEAEVNGGCWTEVARRPPCLKDVQAEHKGKCYLPISKDRNRGGKPAQSVGPD